MKSDDEIDYKFKEYTFILMKVENEKKNLQEEKDTDERDDRTETRESEEWKDWGRGWGWGLTGAQ